MIKYLVNTYKIHLLISLTLFVVILALVVERNAFNIISLLIGSLLGTFLLEADYFLHAYFLEPEKDFSKTVQGFVKHRDFVGALRFIAFHKADVREKTLNSALFQIVLAATLIFIISSTAALWIKALILSTFINALYRMFEAYFEGDIKDWFWAIKMETSQKNIGIYTLVLMAVFIYCLTLLS